MGVLISIPPIVLIAAKALAVAVATRIGEAVGDKLVDAFLGKGGRYAIDAEIITRLDRIEAKLDTIIAFITRELPGVIHTVITEENIRLLQYQLEAKMGSMSFRVETA